MSGVARFAWGVLGYNLLVIVWGAFVRATGSGAGCGNHWPLCNGEVVPRSPELETLIEFGHRATSGLALLAVIALFVWTMRARPAGHPARLGAWLSLILIFVEAALGAGLVLLEMVADNISLARAGWMAGHLVNTLLLVGALTLTAFWLSTPAATGLRRVSPPVKLLAIGLLGMVVVSATGAVTALGDTLFPAGNVSESLDAELVPTAHLLVKLRVIHPALAMLLGVYLLYLAMRRDLTRGPVGVAATAVGGLALVQLLAGAVNIALAAPVWLQLVHLLLADLLWVGLVILTAAHVGTAEPEASAA
jgi:heme A synthase